MYIEYPIVTTEIRDRLTSGLRSELASCRSTPWRTWETYFPPILVPSVDQHGVKNSKKKSTSSPRLFASGSTGISKQHPCAMHNMSVADPSSLDTGGRVLLLEHARHVTTSPRVHGACEAWRPRGSARRGRHLCAGDVALTVVPTRCEIARSDGV